MENRFNTKTDVAYDFLKREITDGTYQPGGRIKISQVARELSVSDIPVREALNRLESEGLVEHTPHVGYKVTHPEFNKYVEVFQVRQLLEGQATALAAEAIRPEAVEELQSLVELMREATEKGNMVALAKLNYKFHHLIYSSCGNSVLIRQVEQVWAIYPRTRSIFTMIPERAITVQAEHEEIFQAIKAGDALRAKQTMFEHKQRSYDLLVNYNIVNHDSHKGALKDAPADFDRKELEE